ncbi:MAG: tRNA (guanosine(37)-N1)-methyltransferase TrmD [Eubacterium sp.]|jgi:tRNA (guanine37-N1)-methyltransferase|nr:tRNA (guanosine(37)-N1)-methyltransferase TrmD [Eubacterium sp.]
MHFHILTLFPEMITQALNTSIIGRAVQRGCISIDAVNIRDYTADRHNKTDDYPYGGGAGMVMQAQPVYDAWKAVLQGAALPRPPRTVYLTPQAPVFTQDMAKELAQEEHLILLCGHYEGIDERVLEEIVTDYVSIGDYVLTGGELAAMVVTDAVARMVPGVLSNALSGSTESLEGNLLEYPQYSRPEEWNGKKVPSILLSGDHAKVDAWRREQSVLRTLQRRPDLLARADLTKQEREKYL